MSQRADIPGYPGRARGVPDPDMRVGDAERNQVAEALSQHYSDGRLDASELKERLDSAIGAKTRGDLAGLMTDLPPLGTPPAAQAPPRPRRTGLLLTLAVLLLLVSVPWHYVPWPFIPRVPWLVIGAIAFVVWRRSRRSRHRRAEAGS